jgi:predicted TIM-barrel fold metal-dependent hydrolase
MYRLIDCDVHHLPRADTDVLDYLPQRWREYVAPPHGSAMRLYRPVQMIDHPDGVNTRLDSFPEAGGPAGSDYELMRRQLLDPYGVDAALLNWGSNGAVANGELAEALCVAENDWCVERWLDGDERLFAAIAAPMHVPEHGADEIRRCGANPRFAAVLLTYHPFGRPIGHPVYEPIYEAATEMDLPLYLHVNIGEHNGGTGPQMSGGTIPNYRFELFVAMHHSTANHLTSMIMHGVFERHPTLRMIVAENGLAWLAGFAARLDSGYEAMRRESRWVKRRPSEYLREHIFLGTQPFEAMRSERRALIDELSAFEGIEDMICFSSDYPHWDNDAPSFVQSVFPAGWQDRVFRLNAMRALRLPARA